MATPISDEELQLKKRARRRLIGAIALVTVVAVFLPMVLDHEPQPVNQDIAIQIPSQNAGTFTSKIVPVVPGAAEKQGETPAAARPAPAARAPEKVSEKAPEKAPEKATAAADKGAPAEKAPTVPAPKATPLAAGVDSEAAPAEARPKPAVEAKAKAEAKPKSDVKAKAAAEAKPSTKSESKEGGGFVVQVAALTDADKAAQLRDQIAAAGVKAYTEVVPTAKGSVTRVRAGPFASRGAADKARDRLKDLGLAGNVVPK